MAEIWPLHGAHVGEVLILKGVPPEKFEKIQKNISSSNFDEVWWRIDIQID